jgi:hypothetical protein
MGAQNLGGMAGFAAGGPIGGIAGSWAGCTVVTYGFLHADFAQKERWDLHPEKASGNWWWSTKMCSPLGFAFRSMEEREPYRKITALMGGLVWVPDPWVNLVGQLAPAAPAVTDNLKFIATALPSAPKSGRYSWQSTPYHTAGWAATTP